MDSEAAGGLGHQLRRYRLRLWLRPALRRSGVAEERDTHLPLRRVVANQIPDSVEACGGEGRRPLLGEVVVVDRVDLARAAKPAGKRTRAVREADSAGNVKLREASGIDLLFGDRADSGEDLNEAAEGTVREVAGPQGVRKIEPVVQVGAEPPGFPVGSVDAPEAARGRERPGGELAEILGRGSGMSLSPRHPAIREAARRAARATLPGSRRALSHLAGVQPPRSDWGVTNHDAMVQGLAAALRSTNSVSTLGKASKGRPLAANWNAGYTTRRPLCGNASSRRRELRSLTACLDLTPNSSCTCFVSNRGPRWFVQAASAAAVSAARRPSSLGPPSSSVERSRPSSWRVSLKDSDATAANDLAMPSLSVKTVMSRLSSGRLIVNGH